jgi:hypothetical protein
MVWRAEGSLLVEVEFEGDNELAYDEDIGM